MAIKRLNVQKFLKYLVNIYDSNNTLVASNANRQKLRENDGGMSLHMKVYLF